MINRFQSVLGNPMNQRNLSLRNRRLLYVALITGLAWIVLSLAQRAAEVSAQGGWPALESFGEKFFIDLIAFALSWPALVAQHRSLFGHAESNPTIRSRRRR